MTRDLSHLFSDQARARKPTRLKTVAHYRTVPDFGFLAGGYPLPSYFAWDTVSATARLPPFTGGLNSEKADSSEKLSFTVAHDSERDYPLGSALQYGVAAGPQPIRDFLVEHTSLIHRIPYDDWDVVTTVGSTQAWDACIRTFCNVGDSILVEKYAYSSALETAAPMGVNLVPMQMDEFGVVPQKLAEKLAMISASGGIIPKLMYIIPTGQNPTGTCLPADRRKEIYSIASEYDLVIVEDEPYYFLQLEPYKDKTTRKDEGAKPRISTATFLDSLVPSFLSLDTEGRVVRLDSFSKVLAPGARLGWVTAQKRIIERFLRTFETSFQSPSGFASSIVYGTLSRWGHDGYIEWLKVLREEYTYKRDLAIDLCLEYLPAVAKFNVPVAGMFFTVSLDTARHPEFATTYKSDPLAVEAAIFEATLENKAILVPGSWFEVADGEESSVIFFRGSYAAVNEEVLEKAVRRFSDAVTKVFLLE